MDDLTLIDDLTMHALISKGERGLTSSEIQKALRSTGAPAAATITSVLERLCGGGFVEQAPRAPKQKSVRYRLLAAGMESIRTRLPEDALEPRARGKASRLLAVQRAFGLDPRLASAVLRKKDGLATYILAKSHGLEFRASTTPADLARRIAGAELNASDTNTATLWNALITRGLTPIPTTTPAATSQAVPHEPEKFAEQVRRAAPRAMNGWLGPQKLFIHRAWEAWRDHSAEPLDLAEFKSNLVRACRTGELSLARADFTLGLDPADLASSETRDGSEVFHFLTIAKEEQQ